MEALEASRIITDEYSVKILMATFQNPKTAIELSREMDIPIAACYRRIRSLEQSGLLRCAEFRPSLDGKRIAAYESLLQRAVVSIENGSMKTRFEKINGDCEDYDASWRDI